MLAIRLCHRRAQFCFSDFSHTTSSRTLTFNLHLARYLEVHSTTHLSSRRLSSRDSISAKRGHALEPLFSVLFFFLWPSTLLFMFVYHVSWFLIAINFFLLFYMISALHHEYFFGSSSLDFAAWKRNRWTSKTHPQLLQSCLIHLLHHKEKCFLCIALRVLLIYVWLFS